MGERDFLGIVRKKLWLRSSSCFVWVLGESDAVEEAGDDEGQDCEGNQLSSERGLLLSDLIHLVVVTSHLAFFSCLFLKL